jgi:hypothetical protein
MTVDVPNLTVADGHLAPRPMRIGETLPKAMGNLDMMRAFGISKPTFFRLQRLGQFKQFLLPRPIAGKKYSGERVQTFLNGRKG